MNASILLSELTEIKYRRMNACALMQRHCESPAPYALSTALELLAVEMPRVRHRRLLSSTMVAVPHANRKYRAKGISHVVWSFPLETVMVDRFTCTTPACTWAMFAQWLSLEELIVLADSMMRRDGRLRRAVFDDFVAYLGQVREFVREQDRPRLFRGYRNCRRALVAVRENTDSSQESRTRLTLMRYGLDAPQVNYPVYAHGSDRPMYLDMAYPEFRICVEYEGAHHAGQWLADVSRRQMIEDLGWRYVQVSTLDLGDEPSEEKLAGRVARHIEEVTGTKVPLTMRQSMRQVCDGRGLRRKPLYRALGFTPLEVPNESVSE